MAARGGANPLTQFAEKKVATKQHGPKCSVCLLPERTIIDEARRQSPELYGGTKAVGGKTVRAWLIEECGYTEETAPTVSQIVHHFSRGHESR